DHRFLTRRGWKHVTGTDQGRDRRPHLTTDDELLGTGAIAVGPDHDGDYQLGYLCGMVRGDGHLGSDSYLRPRRRRAADHHVRRGRASADVHEFRLALVDLEALRRSRGYLAELGVCTSEFVFAEAAGDRRPVWAIRNSTRSGVDAVRSMACFPTAPSKSWRAG